MKVCVLGAAGGIGQPLSLLLKQNPAVTQLALYDVLHAEGVATDLSHICTPAHVSGFPREKLDVALRESQLVLIPAGVPRRPGMSRDDLFALNAAIVKSLVQNIAIHCPQAHILMISNPINATVPLAADVLKRARVFVPSRLYGITTLDVVRANTFVREAIPSEDSPEVTVVGGHSGKTIIPLLHPFVENLSAQQITQLTARIQFGGDEVVKAKNGQGSATLSMAFAASRFSNSLIAALQGAEGRSECAFVENPEYGPRVPFFSSRVHFCRDGISRIDPVGKTSDFEKSLLETCIPELEKNIQMGVDFAR